MHQVVEFCGPSRTLFDVQVGVYPSYSRSQVSPFQLRIREVWLTLEDIETNN